jgi:hypothetical protein
MVPHITAIAPITATAASNSLPMGRFMTVISQTQRRTWQAFCEA